MQTVSIIIPVYNSEKYLDTCIKSILMQSYKNWECILVDDGSMDQSHQICEEYAKQDSRIKAIHTENKGRVQARKTGIENAEGHIITFIDSDDWIEPQTIERMYTEMVEKDVDCVVMGYIETSSIDERVVLNKMDEGIYRDKELRQQIFPYMLCHDDFFEFGIQPYLWNKLFKREIIEPFILNVDERLVIGEDVVSVFGALCNVDSISIVNDAYYHYCIHGNSTMRVFRDEKDEVENIRIQYQCMKSLFSSSLYHEYLIPQLERYIMHHLIVRAFTYVNGKKNGTNMFPFEEIPVASRIIIYGAGAFGTAVYQFLNKNMKYKISGWCDRDYEKLQKLGYSVQSIESVLEFEFDYIVVAVMNEKNVEAIKQSLVRRGVEKMNIKWLDVERLKNIFNAVLAEAEGWK